MPEGFFNATEGSGKKLHTWQRTIGANDVHDEVILHGEPHLASYTTIPGAVSIATVNDHVLELMAGSTLVVYVRRIEVYQVALATAAAVAQFNILRLTTAGTGGTAQNLVPLDTTDAAAGATSMTLPTTKGTEGSIVWRGAAMVTQTVPTAGGDLQLFAIDFDKLRTKGLRIPAGTSNGIALKNLTAVAACTVFVNVWLSEANF